MPTKGRRSTRMTPGFTGPFKGEPQPGTLFDKRALDQLPGNVKGTSRRAGPRGYSPARLAEVRGAFETARTTGPNTATVSHPIEVNAPGHVSEDSHLFGPTPGGGMGRAKSRIIDTMARSTMNVTDEMKNPLAGLGSIKMGVRSSEVAGEYEHAPTVANPKYDPKNIGQSNLTTGDPRITLYTTGHHDPMAAAGKAPHAEQTLLHELGHHDSWIEATESSRYETPSQMATEEARADKFALTHYRSDPRNKEPYEPRENTYAGRGLKYSHFERAANVYEHVLPKEMHPPVKKNRNLGSQFEQQTLANPFFFGTAERY